MRLRLRSEPNNQNSVISYCYYQMDVPKALVFRPLVKGNEALGTRMGLPELDVARGRDPQIIHPVYSDSRRLKRIPLNLQDKSLSLRSRKSGRKFVRWDQLLCGSVFTPIPCTKFKIIAIRCMESVSVRK